MRVWTFTHRLELALKQTLDGSALRAFSVKQQLELTQTSASMRALQGLEGSASVPFFLREGYSNRLDKQMADKKIAAGSKQMAADTKLREARSQRGRNLNTCCTRICWMTSDMHTEPALERNYCNIYLTVHYSAYKCPGVLALLY